MSRKAVNLERMTLWVPRLWEKDWDGAIRNATGVEERLLRIQARAANLLRQVKDRRVTFERLACLNLWTKAFAALDGTFCALSKHSLYLLRILARASFEQFLHALTIIEPILEVSRGAGDTQEKTRPQSQRDGKLESFKRLEAYTAWCIWNDSIFYEQVVHPETLDTVWDADPAQQIASDLKSLEAYEETYGQLKIEMDERELKKGRLRQQDEGQHRLHRIRTWLNHPDLKSWHEKLQKHKFMTFFSLVGKPQKGVKNSLENFDLSFGYPIYSEGSMAIHGSSLDQFVRFSDGSVIPLFAGATDEVSAKAEEVGDYCNKVIVILDMLCKRIWPDESGSDFSGGNAVDQKK